MNTPRTDAFEKHRIVEATTNDIATEAWSDFARQLERELNSTKKEVSDWVFNANELQKGYNKLDREAQELKRENERLREALKEVLASASPHPMENGVMYEAWNSARKALAAQLEEKTK